MNFLSARSGAALHFNGKEIVIEGFLKKSSHSQNQNEWIAWCIPRRPVQNTKWRKRYFVLYKVRYPRETEVLFEYFRDERCKRSGGYIDLKSCTHVYADNHSSNVFVMLTQLRGKPHAYKFYADTLEDRTNWIDKLVRVMNMVVENPHEPIQPSKRPALTNIGLFNPLSCKDTQPWLVNSNNQQPVNFLDPCAPSSDLTDEYRETFDSSELDGYYPLFKSPKHAYINLPTDTQLEAPDNVHKNVNVSVLNEQPKLATTSPDNDVYFNAWETEHSGQTEATPSAVGNIDSQSSLQMGPYSNAMVEERSDTELPVRIAPNCPGEDSSSSSDDEDDEEEEREENPGLVKKESEDANELPIPSNLLGKPSAVDDSFPTIRPSSPVEKPAKEVAMSSETVYDIQYLEAESICFPAKPNPPAIPPRPTTHSPFLKKIQEPCLVGTVDENERRSMIEYKEVDFPSTNALAFVTKHFLEDDQTTA